MNSICKNTSNKESIRGKSPIWGGRERERERETADINVKDLISLPKRNLLSGIIDLSNKHIIKIKE